MIYFFKQLRFIKYKDILACFVFILALPISWLYRMKRKNMWLICERSDEARDNGYWFYRYLQEQHPEIDSVYAIKKNSVDFEKLKNLNGKIIEFGSFKHWVYYLTAEVNISSQKEGKPNAAVCHLLEIYGIRKNKRVYLKHGIVCNDLKWHYYDVMKVWLYICTTKREYDYCKEKFGYNDDNMALTGLCRYDNLNNENTDNKTIFIMPTKREWIARPIKEYEKFDNIYKFQNTEYFKQWSSFLENPKLNQYIQKYNLDVIFFLHPVMQRFVTYFEKLNTNAKIKCNLDVDLQTMIKKSAVMITDYSSVSFDFAYMKKPLLYFQFDYEKFRSGHYQEGYFSYTNDGFGQVCETSEELCNNLCNIIDNGINMNKIYKKRVDEFFLYRDSNNCNRVYNAIINKLEKGKMI